MVVVYGGTSSGKSNIAESIAKEQAMGGRLYYLATMETSSKEAKRRIVRHRSLRQDKGFETIEEMYDVAGLAGELAGSSVLLECMSNLVANILFRECGESPIAEDRLEPLAQEIADQIVTLDKTCRLTIVTNNIFETGYSTDAWCDGYMRLLGRVNELMAAQADCFVEVTAGTVNALKGELRWQL